MLYNPKWNRPSVAGFKAWLEAQPKEGPYSVISPLECPLGKYLRALGSSCAELQRQDSVMYAMLLAFPMRVRAPKTFGRLLAEIETATTLLL
jgi:hypothetical protein